MNWQQMVKDLLESGYTQVQLAERLKCTQSTVSGMASGERGIRPSWELGEEIIKAHRAMTKKKAA